MNLSTPLALLFFDCCIASTVSSNVIGLIRLSTSSSYHSHSYYYLHTSLGFSTSVSAICLHPCHRSFYGTSTLTLFSLSSSSINQARLSQRHYLLIVSILITFTKIHLTHLSFFKRFTKQHFTTIFHCWSC